MPEDKDSGELRRPHHLDLKTGMYKGRQVLKKKESLIGFGNKARLRLVSARIWPTSGPTVPLGEALLRPGDNPVIL